MKYYLRMEGVNLSNFVYDTQDLSTIRGGGLLLLDAVERVKKTITNITLDSISTGASSGLFSFDATRDEDAESARKNVEKMLTKDHYLKHATFVVDVLPASGDFRMDRERLIAANRWRQMQSPSVTVPGAGSDVCYVDMVRPATRRQDFKDKKNVPISESVIARRCYGIEKKQSFYESLTDIKADFVLDLDKLTDYPRMENLHHKMAVIYIDGNGFGKIQEKLKTPKSLNSWDTKIRGFRKNLLKQLLNKTINIPEWTWNGEGERTRHRMETLLWGGDEILLVVPAWVGWWTLSFFFNNARTWIFEQKNLKHAAGLVFCHHKAPIHRVKDLAKSLADSVKQKDRSKNLFAYQVFESFDHTGSNTDKYRMNLCPPGMDTGSLILDGENMDKISECIQTLKDTEFSRSKIHAILYSILRGRKSEADALTARVMKDISPDTKNMLDTLSNLLNGENMRWLHIADLWDYTGRQA